VEISGVGVATVGIQYYFLCTSECYPGCTYSWTRGNETSQGAGLNLKLADLVPTQTLTCTVHNPTTGEAASVQKTVKVTGMSSGPQTKARLHIRPPEQYQRRIMILFSLATQILDEPLSNRTE